MASDGKNIHDGLFFMKPELKSSGVGNGELVNYLRNLFIIARDHKRVRYDNWIRNYKLVNNRSGASSASWMPNPKSSEIYPVLSALVGWMTDQNTQIDFIPAADPHGTFYDFILQVCNDLMAVFNSTWQVEDYAGQIKLTLWDAFMYSVGLLKNVWDGTLDDGYGNAIMRRVDPWSFYPDPHATSMDDSEYFIEVRRMSYDAICRKFPDAEALLSATGGSGEPIDERPSYIGDGGGMPKANPGALPGGNGVYNKTTSSSGRLTDPMPGYVVYEFWIRENVTEYDRHDPQDGESGPVYGEKHVYDSWRVIVMCNNQILMNESAHDLWSHGQHPYERFVFDDLGEFYGISLVDHLAHPQLYINRLLTALQHNAELTGNPILLEPTVSNTSRIGIFNKPGQRIPINGSNAMMNAPKWLDPPQMPPEVMNLIQFWVSRMENISGLSAIVRGATPTARNAEGVISSIQEAAFVRIRSAQHNLETTLARSSYKLADLIVENYTEPRITAIVGPQGQQSALALHGHHFYVPGRDGSAPLKYIMNVKAGASMPTSRQARIAEAEQLFTLGAIDDQAVLEAHQWSGIPEILERLYKKRQMGVVGGGPGTRQRAGH